MDIRKRALTAVVLMAVSIVFAEDAYIEATGSQYIRTGYLANPKTKIICDFAYTEATPTQQERIFGADSDSSEVQLSFSSYVNGNRQYAWAFQDGKGNWSSLNVAADTTRRVLKLDGFGSKVSLDPGKAEASLSVNHTRTSVWPLAIFANNRSTDYSAITHYAKARLYSFRIYDGGTLVHYYLPYKSGEIVGLKDMISGAILTDPNGRGFTSGGDISDNPVPTSKEDDIRIGADGELEFRVRVSASAGGTVAVDGVEGPVDRWITRSDHAAIRVDAMAVLPAHLTAWTGDIGAIGSYNGWMKAVNVKIEGPVSLTATFATTSYSYTYPKYVVTLEGGCSNSFKDVTSIVKFDSVADEESQASTTISYADFLGGATSGSLLKKGAGTLVIDAPIAQFDGNVHVMEGVLIACCSNALGKAYLQNANVKETEKNYVHNGATLVMDAGAGAGTIVYPESAAIYFEGDGAPGMGGAWVHRNGANKTARTYWPWGVQSKATGPATIFIDMASGGESSIVWRRQYDSVNKLSICHSTDVNFQGNDILIYGRSVGTVLSLEAAQIAGIGNLVVSNLTAKPNGNSAAFTPKTAGQATLQFTGGSRLVMNKSDNLSNNEKNHNYELVLDNLEYFGLNQTNDKCAGWDPWGGQTNLWWHGSVTLNCDLRVYRMANRKSGFTLEGRVSGPRGIRPWAAANGNCYTDRVVVNLLSPENDFKGGIVLDRGTLAVWRNGAVPPQDDAGLVSITNGCVSFGKMPTATAWENFTMPETEFVGSGAVTNGTGRWRALVKKGTGALDYNSQLDGDVLDLQGGTVKLNSAYRANYADEEGFTASVPKFDVLKGTVGTLDVNGLAEVYEVERLEDTPSVDNADVRVKDGWAVSAAALKAGTVATFSGTLSFDSGATVSVTDVENLPSQKGGYVLARANAITGFTPHACGPFCALVDSDGKTLRVKRTGFMILMK